MQSLSRAFVNTAGYQSKIRKIFPFRSQRRTSTSTLLEREHMWNANLGHLQLVRSNPPQSALPNTKPIPANSSSVSISSPKFPSLPFPGKTSPGVTFQRPFQQVLESSEQVVSIQYTSRPYHHQRSTRISNTRFPFHLRTSSSLKFSQNQLSLCLHRQNRPV